jgi:hypothetical protein
MTDRRRFSADDITEIGEIFAHTLADRSSLKKNGHTWREWVVKVFTPERLVLIFVAIISMAYSFGGDIRAARTQLTTAAAKADVASTKAELAAAKSEAAAVTNVELQQQLQGVIHTLQEQKAQQATFNAQINDRVALAVTRAEFRSAVTQQILPRLERIEKAQPK